MLKATEIRGMSVDEIEQKIADLKKELLTLRVELRAGKLEKHGRIREVKKSIARLMTILQEEKRKASAKDKPAKKVAK